MFGNYNYFSYVYPPIYKRESLSVVFQHIMENMNISDTDWTLTDMSLKLVRT